MTNFVVAGPVTEGLVAYCLILCADDCLVLRCARRCILEIKIMLLEFLHKLSTLSLDSATLTSLITAVLHHIERSIFAYAPQYQLKHTHSTLGVLAANSLPKISLLRNIQPHPVKRDGSARHTGCYAQIGNHQMVVERWGVSPPKISVRDLLDL